MTFLLKTSGIATNLVMCVAIDDDGTTIKEFVSSDVNTNMTLDTGVAASVSAATWKGVSRGYWSSTANGGFDYNGVRFASGHRPSRAQNAAGGWTLFSAFAKVGGAGGGNAGIISYSSTAIGGARRSATGKYELYLASGARGAGSTTIPIDTTTKYSAGVTYNETGGVGAVFYYGLESGSMAADGTSTAGIGFTGAATVFGIGGFATAGNQPGSHHIDCLFNTVLTLTQMQSLHDDWFNTLFQSTGKLFRSTLAGQLSGLGVGGPFFQNPLQ